MSRADRVTKKPKSPDDETARLRRQAEETLKKETDIGKLEHRYTDEKALVHELQVHQVELEIQNQELIRAREEAERLQENYIDLYDFSPVGYFTLEADGTIDEVNLTGCKLLGYDRSLITGRRFQTFLHPEYIPDFNTFCRNILKSEGKQICELELLRNEQVRFFASAQGSGMPGGRKEPGRIRMTISDITDRKKMEEALSESSSHYKQLVENINDVIFTIDLNGIITYISPVINRLYGYAPEEVINVHFSRFVHPDDLLQVSEAFTCRVGGEYGENVFRIRTRDGRERYVSTRQTPIVKDGKITGFNYLMADITDRKQIEKTLIESEKRYRTLFEDSPVSLWEEDFSGIKSWIDSKKAEGITDFDAYFSRHPEDLEVCTRMVKVNNINTTTRTLVGAESENQFYKGIGLVFTEKSYSTLKDEIVSFVSGKPRYQGISVISTLSGDKRDILIWCSIVPGYETTWGKVLISIMDISDRIAAEKALQQANRKLNLLSSITRHDILNGVAVLLGYIELAGDEVRSPGMQEYIGNMDKAAKSIQHQIEFTKEYQEIGVNAAAWQNIMDTVQKTGSVFRMENVSLNINCGNIEIFADPLLRKVFYNLFDNAFRYAPPFTTISVTCEETGEGLSVVFADDGAGIGEEIREHLFERGFGNHTGLGLFLSREILAITGITITENGTPGKGARFEMTVPKGAYRYTGISGENEQAP